MTLESFYFIAQILAALAVVGSLIFVGLQVRAQTQEQKIHRVHERASVSVALNEWVAKDPEVRRALAKAYGGLDDLTDDEFSIYMAFLRQALILLQLSFSQVPPGPADFRSQSAFPTLARLFAGVGFGQFWYHFRNDYPEAFCLRMEELLIWAEREKISTYPGRATAYTAGGFSDDA